ncbi:MAG: hypothetical protein ACOH10_10900 [Rhodoglobus sp.]
MGQELVRKWYRHASIVVVAGVAAVAIGREVTPGYDTSFTLAWGRDLITGLPLDFAHPSSPTPHPLAVAWGALVGALPLGAAVTATGLLTAAAAIFSIATLGYLAWQTTGTWVPVGTTILTAVVSAPLWLLVLGGSSDIAYTALGATAVALSVHRRFSLAVAVFMVAALLRPEAALLALVPLIADVRTPHPTDPRRWWSRSRRVFVAGVAVATGAWLATGAIGGDPLISLHSAAGNAAVNNDPRGLGTAITDVLPGLAGPCGWLLLVAAAGATLSALFTVRGRRRPAQTQARSRTTNATRAANTRASTIAAGRAQATVTVAAVVGVGVLAYLGQGMLGTPLVARYLLLPALLCLPIAAGTIPALTRPVRPALPRAALTGVLAVILVGAAAVSNVGAWKDVTSARDLRADLFAEANELLHSPLVRNCTGPVIVRSPALVARTALELGRPLIDVQVADKAGTGVLLQPLTLQAATLDGYGPMISATEQAIFPTDAPPRANNTNWAVYSTCQS